MDCPFCNINKEKTRIIKEGKNVFVVFSNPRLMKGHLLVIPKRHILKISELDKEEKEELLDTVIEFQEKILQKISSGCDVRQNYRPFQKQTGLKVDHLHIHLLPREFEDELYQKCQINEKRIFSNLEEEEIKRISTLLG